MRRPYKAKIRKKRRPNGGGWGITDWKPISKGGIKNSSENEFRQSGRGLWGGGHTRVQKEIGLHRATGGSPAGGVRNSYHGLWGKILPRNIWGNKEAANAQRRENYRADGNDSEVYG